jgi:hypothetical protein
MYLLVLILDKTKDFENLIPKWKEIGITGVTIFDSIGIGKNTLYESNIPIIASLAKIFDSDTRKYNHTLLSVMESEEMLLKAIKAVEDVCGDFTQPDVGIMFSIKLDRVIGFTPINNNNNL